MRLTGGFLRGRVLFYRKTSGLRPTRNIVREAVFDMICNYIKDSRVLEIFAGTGALGFEALSRGARSVIFVDNSLLAVNLIKKNARILNLEDSIKVMRMDVKSALKKLHTAGCRFDIIFSDPPYEFNLSGLKKVFSGSYEILADSGLFIIETGKTINVSETSMISGFRLIKEKIYGSARIQIYKKEGTAGSISG